MWNMAMQIPYPDSIQTTMQLLAVYSNILRNLSELLLSVSLLSEMLVLLIYFGEECYSLYNWFNRELN